MERSKQEQTDLADADFLLKPGPGQTIPVGFIMSCLTY